MQTIRVLGLHPLRPGMIAMIEREIPGIEWLARIDGEPNGRSMPGELPAPDVIAAAEVVFAMPLLSWLVHAKSVRWVQLASAGVGRAFCAEALKKGCAVTNLSGVYSQSIAEHVMGLMLALSRRLDVAIERQREQSWGLGEEMTLADLAGKTVGILGAGSIGQAIARMCKAFGMQVLGCRRSARRTLYFDRIYSPKELKTMAAESNWLVLAAPLTNQTEGIVDAAVLAALPAGARLINVGRGKLIDEAAFVQAMRSGHLAGAGIDVAVTEPLPAESPLWTLSNVIVTPHVAGDPIDASDAVGERFLRNLHRYQAGEPLESTVDLIQGY